MSNNLENSDSVASTTCSNCHSTMPAELRFCRNCEFRLGEGIAELNETIRFDSAHPQMVAGAAAATVAPRRRRRRMSGMTWIFVGLLVFFVGAAAFTAVVSPFKPHNRMIDIPKPPKSFVGVNGFDTAENGVTFERVDAPDTPADKAGLVGGDIITSFDGQQIHN